MQPKFKKLRVIMCENQIDQKTLANEIGISQGYLSERITAKRPFTMRDAYRVCDFLQIPYEKLAEYFPKNGGDASAR